MPVPTPTPGTTNAGCGGNSTIHWILMWSMDLRGKEEKAWLLPSLQGHLYVPKMSAYNAFARIWSQGMLGILQSFSGPNYCGKQIQSHCNGRMREGHG